ncbi:lysoplasmalogenase [Maribacter halichondriae]|uniref:lysoplasmalogenase n=1 Tax=Maribacter halichondriae TaxID=2980554 RepID=UPI0023585363|nr:lysoplasmalogenase [Maribacter sp. Hal144]
MKVQFWQIYILLVLMDIVIGSFDLAQYRVVTKPLILISLLTYFAISGKRLPKSTYYIMLLALLFSLMGDIFLLFDERSNTFFILGLVSFLLAHITYGTVFLKKRNKKLPFFLYGVMMLLIGIGMLLFFYINDSLGDLTYPVMVYVLGILFMAITALLRVGKVRPSSFLWVFVGALFFIASDSILAINMFKFEIPFSNVLIMGTYATAQYLIVSGIVRENEPIKNLSTL